MGKAKANFRIQAEEGRVVLIAETESTDSGVSEVILTAEVSTGKHWGNVLKELSDKIQGIVVREMLLTLLPSDIRENTQRLQEYIEEAEHQDGYSHWTENFSTPEELAADIRLAWQIEDSCDEGTPDPTR